MSGGISVEELVQRNHLKDALDDTSASIAKFFEPIPINPEVLSGQPNYEP